MKKIYLVVLLALGGLSTTSCGKWLDVMPDDIIEQEDLFSEGTGYRNALNGVYRQLSSSAMYGCDLSYGMVEAMGQVYESYSFGSLTVLQNFFKYNYTDTKAKARISALWTTAYSAVANCNNIITSIAGEPDSKFKQGKLEKELILGEALALRGFLHFLMACYFAPAPVTNPTGAWIPYYETFPQTVANYLSVTQCLERCAQDLEQAKIYVGAYENYESTKISHPMFLRHECRFFQHTSAMDLYRYGDIFFVFRGYRMNYTAVMAVLARVYSYAGKYEQAAAEAQEVIDYIAVQNNKIKAFTFTEMREMETNYKMTPDLIFALSDENLLTHYAEFVSTAEYGLTLASSYSSYFDSESDYRKKILILEDGWDMVPLRYTTPKLKGSYTNYIYDVLPVIRLSEMYYIKAEWLAAQANYNGATEALEAVRIGRGCKYGLLQGKIDSPESFKKELLNEARREFVEEGLTFYYFKKYGEKLKRTMTDASWYFPYPDNETIN